MTTHHHKIEKENSLLLDKDESSQQIVTRLKNRAMLLQDQLEFSRLEVKLLRELGEAILYNATLEETLNQVTATVYRMLDAEAVLISIFDEPLTSYSFRSGIGLAVDSLIGTTYPLDQGINGWMIKNQSAWWHGAALDISPEHCTEWEQDADNILMVPFVGQKQMLGSIACFNKVGSFNFSKQDFDFLTLLTRQISTAIEMMRLQESHRELILSLEERVLSRTEQLDQARKDADRANIAKSKFLANMSHELRTPMNAILGYAQLLKEESLMQGPHLHYAEIIDRSGQNLLALVDDVLDLARIESGRLQLSMGIFLLSGLISDLALLFQQGCEEKNIEWIVDASTVLPLELFGDQHKLKQLLVNLIGNAVKFTDHGSVTLRIMENNGQLHFFVEDTGVGMDADALENIFEPFQQTGDGARRGGTGLGLNIARSLVQLMGGSLRVDSHLGEGSLFSFAVMLAKPVAASLARPLLRFEFVPGNELKVLVVDAVQSTRDLLVDLLKAAGCTVSSASSATLGERKAESFLPDLVFIDQDLPDGEGRSLWSAIQDRLPHHGARTSMIETSWKTDSDKPHNAIPGMIGHVSKPYRESEILFRIADHFGLIFDGGF